MDQNHILHTMEHCNFNIKFSGTIVHCHIIYRIPSMSVINFCGELTSIMEDTINLEQGRLLFVGDFNIHMDEPTQPDTITFLDWLESFNLRNHVTFSTHQSKHTLDLVITEQNDASIKTRSGSLIFGPSLYRFLHGSTTCQTNSKTGNLQETQEN